MACHPSDLWHVPCPMLSADEKLVNQAKEIAREVERLERHPGWKVLRSFVEESRASATRTLITSSDGEEREGARRRLAAASFFDELLDLLKVLPQELEMRKEPSILRGRQLEDDPVIMERAALLAEALHMRGWKELMAVVRGVLLGWRVLLPHMPAETAQWVIDVTAAIRSVLARVRELISRSLEEGVA